MYTQCPHCQTCFRIAEEHLKIANGKVRCGSCQEVFDATQHLFKNLTDREPITFNPPPTDKRPAPPPTEREQAAPRAQPNKDIDLNRPSTPSPQAVEKILQERQKAPDQKHFMESVIDNDRYNNLDKMGAIDIPGNIDFGDSIIKFAEDEKEAEKPAAKIKSTQAPRTTHQDTGYIDLSSSTLNFSEKTKEEKKPATTTTPAPRTAYEDFENKEAPATEAEQETLKHFFAEVDAQLHEDDPKSQLDKDIDELLAFAKGIDQKATPEKPDTQEPGTPDTHAINVSEEFDIAAIADFEKELDAASTDMFDVKKPTEPVTGETQTGKETNTDQAASQSEAVSVPASETHVVAEEHPQKTKTPASAHSESGAKSDTADALPAQEDDIPHALRRSLEMLDRAPRRSLGKTLLLSLLILILIGGLGFQVVLFRNVELAHLYPRLAPLLTQACNRIPCRYSGKVDVSQIKLLSRDVRSDPSQPNALLISATFVDQAPFDQPYPVIQITLYDLGGNVVASRRFTPKEYLQKMYNRFLLMESGTPVHITLAVLDPGKDAINFEFSFL